MNQVLLNIEDQKLEAFLNTIKNLEFVKIESITSDSENEVLNNIKSGLIELNKINNGELKATPLEDFLNEI